MVLVYIRELENGIFCIAVYKLLPKTLWVFIIILSFINTRILSSWILTEPSLIVCVRVLHSWNCLSYLCINNNVTFFFAFATHCRCFLYFSWLLQPITFSWFSATFNHQRHCCCLITFKFWKSFYPLKQFQGSIAHNNFFYIFMKPF